MLYFFSRHVVKIILNITCYEFNDSTYNASDNIIIIMSRHIW